MSQRPRPAHVLAVPRWTLIIHVVQPVLAVAILGLDAYGIRWIPYNALIYSLVVAICTLGVCAYLLVSQLFLHQMYNMYVVLGLHLWMLLFWIVDLGLVANLARIWSNPRCVYYYGYGYSCGYYGKRSSSSSSYSSLVVVSREGSTTAGAYFGALAAGALFAAVEFGLFAASAIITVMHMSKHRSNAATAAHMPAPQYVDGTHNSQTAVSMEKYNQTGQPQQHQQQQQQQQQVYPQPYSTVQTPPPQPQYAQPLAQGQYTPPVPYQLDPVKRTNTVSPVSHAGYTGNATELSTPQHTGNNNNNNYYYNPNAPELSTPPQHAGNYHNPNVSELSTTTPPPPHGAYHHYDPNVSELSSK